MPRLDGVVVNADSIKKRNKFCPECGGMGYEKGSSNPCLDCEGLGVISDASLEIYASKNGWDAAVEKLKETQASLQKVLDDCIVTIPCDECGGAGIDEDNNYEYCKSCDGYGCVDLKTSDPSIEKCVTCNGEGKISDPHAFGHLPDLDKWPTNPCEVCAGSGYKKKPKKKRRRYTRPSITTMSFDSFESVEAKTNNETTSVRKLNI